MRRFKTLHAFALIYVGVLRIGGLKRIDFDDLRQVVPVALMLISMPVSGSIGHGIGLARIACTVIQVFSGKAQGVSALTCVISALFSMKFFLLACRGTPPMPRRERTRRESSGSAYGTAKSTKKSAVRICCGQRFSQSRQ